MYNKKYIVKKIEQFNRYNPIYENMEGHICYLAFLNVGERGYFLHETGLPYDYPHRVHTSIIKNVEYVDNQVIVTTQNTRLVFEEM